jgi:hypothetical protein
MVMGGGAISPGVNRPGRVAVHLKLVPRSRIRIHSPIRLHGLVVNLLSRERTLPYCQCQRLLSIYLISLH